jgi:hypothetical protein
MQKAANDVRSCHGKTTQDRPQIANGFRKAVGNADHPRR